MSKQKLWIGVILLMLGFVVGGYTLRSAAHPSATIPTNAVKTVSPAPMAPPGVTVIDLTP